MFLEVAVIVLALLWAGTLGFLLRSIRQQRELAMQQAERERFARASVEPKMKLAEFRVGEDSVIPVGAEILADHFVVGQFVDVSGTTLGKGFAGSADAKRPAEIKSRNKTRPDQAEKEDKVLPYV